MMQSWRQPSRRLGAVLLLCLVAASATLCGFKAGTLNIAGNGDVRQYLDTAYHIAHDFTFSSADAAAPGAPGIGREPGYPFFLAVLMKVDPQFGRYSPQCHDAAGACDDQIYRAASLANLGFILACGTILYFVALRLCGNVWAGLAAAGYMLFNMQCNRGWADPMSDRFAMLWVCVAMLLAVAAWQRGTAYAWLGVGGALAALTLVKAVFLPYAVLLTVAVAMAAVFRRGARRRILAALAVAVIAYGIPVGGWAARNWQVGGEFRLTDTRGGIALNTRNVFDDMTGEQYLAAFVYWTRGFGNGLARRLFPAEVVAPFDEGRPGGFYDRGQNGYGERVRQVMNERGIGELAAAGLVDRQLETAIVKHPLRHLATTLPLLYRGIWIDEFIVVGFPLFVWMCVRSVRRGDALAMGLLSVGAFNLLFYAAFSLDVPRYQMTAVPVLALAAGMAVSHRLARA